MNTLTHASSGYHDGKEVSDVRDALINLNNHQNSRPSILNQYTMS